ncbi:hypothetical protein COBT_000444 [Conglomerata obtusa]
MKNEMHDLFLCRKTVIEMLRDRNYPTNTSTFDLSFAEFTSSYPNAATDRNTIKIHVQKENDSPLIVHFFDEAKVGLKNLKTLVDSFERQGIRNIILICKENLSPSSNKHIEAISNFNIEVFKEKELLFNVTKHELVPKHRVLNEIEKKEVLEGRRIKEYQLPKILKTDPVARYFGAKRGDVFEIQRKSETAGISLYFRLVV